MNLILSSPDNLPSPQDFDSVHRKWRKKIIRSAVRQKLKFSHGVAAKLINIYLKAGFVCAGHHNNSRVRAIHPPIDRMLLNELSKQDVGGLHRTWNKARRIRWANFNSTDYEAVISNIRTAFPDIKALWEVEKYWRGYQ